MMRREIRKAELVKELKQIEEGWGSVEDYLEEQRRCGIYELETSLTLVNRAIPNKFKLAKKRYYKYYSYSNPLFQILSLLFAKTKNQFL